MTHRRLHSMAPAAMAMASFTIAALPGGATAQLPVDKPTTTTTTYTRLAAPGPVVARQQPDGSILVTWRAIAGAATYQVTRSVPPGSAQVVATPTDTSYVDTNVQPGSAYYYVVAAVSDVGAIGLKSGSQPVTATATTSLVATGSTGSTGGGATSGGTTSTAALAAPLLVEGVLQEGWPFNVVYFGFKQGGSSYRVERTLYSTMKTAPTWQLRQTTGPLACCTGAVLDTLNAGASGVAVMYRVTAVDPTDPRIASPPTMSAWISPNSAGSRPTATSFNLPPTRVISRTDKVGTMIIMAPGAILDQNGVLGVDSRGALVAKAPGVGHYVWGIVSSSGAPFVQILRVTVIP
jgi:hypothetical protein